MRIVIAFLVILQVVEGHGGGDCKRWCGYCDHGGCAWIVRKACCGHFDPSLLFPLHVDVNCSQPNRSRIIPPDNYSDTGESQQCSGFSLVHQHGCLTAMPESYCSYNTTRAIILRWNSFSEFPALSCLEKLGGLDLRNNELTSVPRDAFVGLTMLDEVRLDFNKITHIHPNAFDVPLPKLNRFSISHNLLVSVEPWPLTIPHVFCYFGLSHNRISRLTNERHWTFNISVEAGPGWVDLRYNQFVEPPTAQLSQFRMSLSELGGEVLFWGINIRHNPYHCDCKAYGFARLLRFIYSFTPHNNLLGTCASPPKFKGMYVKDLPQDELTCNVTTNCPQGCACQERPAREDILVDCVDRDLTELPENMPDGKLTLLLANNSIGRTSARGYFRRVVRVDLSENSLEVFDESTPRLLKNAERVDLRGNALRHLPYTFQILSPDVVFLDPDTLTCACDLTWFASWVHFARSERFSRVVCTTEKGHVVNMTTATGKMLGCDDDRDRVFIYSLVSIFMTLFVTVSILIVFRHEALVLTHLMTLRRIRHQARHIRYDVFLSTSVVNEADSAWVCEELLPVLDRSEMTCYWPRRDCVPGCVEMEEASKRLQESASVLVVLSPDYVKSPACLFQFKQAYRQMLKHGRGRLILVCRSSVSRRDVEDAKLRAMVTLRLFYSTARAGHLERIVRELNQFCSEMREKGSMAAHAYEEIAMDEM